MRKLIYDAVYRLFEEGNYNLTINVGQVTLRLHDSGEEDTSIWEFGIDANGEAYTVGELYHDGRGPGNYAELFAGEYDIIAGFMEKIYHDNFPSDEPADDDDDDDDLNF